MPPKDPDQRRAYDRTHKKMSRAKAKLRELTGKDPGGSSKVTHLPTAATAAHALSGELQAMTPGDWTQLKADVAMEMINLGRDVLMAHKETPGNVSVKDANKLLNDGILLFGAAIVEDSERRAEGGDQFNLSRAVLEDPEARELVLALAKIARRIRERAEQLDSEAG